MFLSDLEVFLFGMIQEGFLEDKVFDLSFKGWGKF